jgi:poly(A) polymerase
MNNIIKTFKKNNFKLYFVGGCVRDKLLGEEPKDYDFVTNATPNEIEMLFDRIIPVGKKFGIIMVQDDSFIYEIATMRKDSYSLDHRKPDNVQFTDSIEIDSKRRDFTINGMYMNAFDNEVFDFHNGREDLKNGIIKTIGNPINRIDEDALRILRAIRFSSQLGFNISKELIETILNKKEDLQYISPERIKDEITKILLSDNPRIGLRFMLELGIFHILIPEIHNMQYIKQCEKFHPEGDVFEHTIRVVERTPRNEKLRWAALLHDVGKSVIWMKNPSLIKVVNTKSHESKGLLSQEKILKNSLRFSNSFSEDVLWLCENHMRIKYFNDMKKSKKLKFLSEPLFNDLLVLGKADDMINRDCWKKIEKFQNETPQCQIKPEKLITGNDIIKLGIPEGKMIGIILQEIEELQLENENFNKEDAIEHVKKFT